MKALVWIVVLVGLAFGGKYLYDNGYLDSFMQSFGNTVQRTSDFATDKAINEADY